MKIYYDFHVHTCLSPCGDSDMTPNNIINMAIIKGLDAIAITDHNTYHNAEACIEAARGCNLTVIPGMEVETAEEIHVVTLFPDMNALSAFGEEISATMPPVKNKPEIFGEQIVMNSKDEFVRFEERYLLTACSLGIYEIFDKVIQLGGVPIVAHIDKSSYSVISSLGCIPDDIPISTVEIKNKNYLSDPGNAMSVKKYNTIHNSDAHYLWDISEKDNFLECESNDIKCILNKLKSK